MTNQPMHYPAKNRLPSINVHPRFALACDPELLYGAYHLLQQALPGHWILRPMDTRAPGLDFLLEITDHGGPLDGYTAWIRLEAVEGIRWNKQGRHRGGAIQPPSYYYASGRSYPVLLFLADVLHEELYFLSADYYVQTHFDTYLRKRRLCYCYDRQADRFTYPCQCAQLGAYLTAYAEQQELENLLTVVLTNPDLLTGYLAAGYTRQLMQQVRGLLEGPLAYWAFSNRTVYYLLHSLCQGLSHPDRKAAAGRNQPIPEPLPKSMSIWPGTDLINTNRCC